MACFVIVLQVGALLAQAAWLRSFNAAAFYPLEKYALHFSNPAFGITV
jgi:hypothetical protein